MTSTPMPSEHLKEMSIGNDYSIPHVRAAWPRDTPNWIPVLGPRHNDTEIINFDHEHFHIDIRFLEDDLLEQAEELVPKNSILAISWVYQRVITSVAPDTQERLWVRFNKEGALVEHATEDVLDVPQESWYQVRQTKFRRDYPEHPTFLVPWMKKLEKAYAKARLQENMVCPHRGTDLTGLEIKNGCVTCPLHGLTWNVKTGKLVGSN